MTDKDNIAVLIDAGVIAKADDINPEHRALLNKFTDEEIKAVIKLKNQIIQEPLKSEADSTGGAML